MRRLLGLEVPSDALGCLQDVHWGAGSFGYFPSYALGCLIAAQLWEAIEGELGSRERGSARRRGGADPGLARRARAPPRAPPGHDRAGRTGDRRAAVDRRLHPLRRAARRVRARDVRRRASSLTVHPTLLPVSRRRESWLPVKFTTGSRLRSPQSLRAEARCPSRATTRRPAPREPDWFDDPKQDASGRHQPDQGDLTTARLA